MMRDMLGMATPRGDGEMLWARSDAQARANLQ
jgi:hypothetical protein